MDAADRKAWCDQVQKTALSADLPRMMEKHAVSIRDATAKNKRAMEKLDVRVERAGVTMAWGARVSSEE